MFGDILYAIGITVWYGYAGNDKDGWWAAVEFQDDGHCDNNSIKGEIHTKYGGPLSLQIDTIKHDAEKLGIQFPTIANMTPSLVYLNDGETKDYPPPNDWRQILKKEAKRIGFRSYS